MHIYLFTSSTLTNVWAGIGARRWAVATTQLKNVGGIIKKSQKLLPGALGLIYCTETQSLTTPFLVCSIPDLANGDVSNVWPERWTLSFRIHPLGTPDKQVHKDELKQLLPVLQAGTRPWSAVLHVQPTTAFVPSDIGVEDWQVLVELLADI